MKAISDATSLLTTALVVGLLGGGAAFVLSGFLASVTANVWTAIVVDVVILAVALTLAYWAKADNLSVFRLVTFLAAIGIVGTVLSMFVPTVSGYLLTTTFSVQGLLFSFLYIMIAEVVLVRTGLGKSLGVQVK